MPADVSILILAFNKSEYTRRCLQSLFSSSLRPFEVVLVNNGSTDDTEQVFDEFASRAAADNVAVTRLKLENLGAIVGRNRGMERMSGKYWVLLDNDIVVRTRSWMEKLRAVLDANASVGVVAPKLVYPIPPYNIQCAGCTVTRGGQMIFRGRGSSRETPDFNQPAQCQTLISACWMMRADDAKRVGKLDEMYSPIQFEDHDYCYRMRESGLSCRYEPSVEMFHFENVTSGRTGALNYPYLTVKNGLKFKNKWRHRFSAENGPDDKEWSWANIPTVSLDSVAETLPTID
jgi:GT2 family glycosyltransferase